MLASFETVKTVECGFGVCSAEMLANERLKNPLLARPLRRMNWAISGEFFPLNRLLFSHLGISKMWPVRPNKTGEHERKKYFVIEVFVIWFVCLGLGSFFEEFYGRSASKITTLLLSCGLAGVGLLTVLLVSARYLEIYMCGIVSLTFVVSLALVLVLVTSKVPLVEIYDKMPSGSPERSLYLAFFSAATLEELVKCSVYVSPLIFAKRFRSVYDLAFLAICAGSCFATIENLIAASAGPIVMLQRFLWCTLTHTTDCLTGALILAHIKARYSSYDWRGLCLLPLVIVVPIALHGSYDFVIFVAYDEVADSWVSALSVVIGVLSILIALSLFYPFRRGKWGHVQTATGITVEPFQNKDTELRVIHM